MINTDNLLHHVLNQMETDFDEQDYEAIDEMLKTLIKDENARDILYEYLSDERQDELAKGLVDKRY